MTDSEFKGVLRKWSDFDPNDGLEDVRTKKTEADQTLEFCSGSNPTDEITSEQVGILPVVTKRGDNWRGRSLEERLGLERAREVRAKIGVANRGRKNTEETKLKMRNAALARIARDPANENTYKNTLKGWYKGVFFRSSYEYFFLKLLEKDGIDIQNDVKTEPFRVPYVYENENHVYIPDFWVVSRNTVYEVKPREFVTRPDVIAKLSAAAVFFDKMTFLIVTQDELASVLPSARKIKSTILRDPCVFLLPKHVSDDRWSAMFKQQDEFMKLLQTKRIFPVYPLDLSKKEHQRIIKDISHDCMHELFEAVHMLKNSKLHRATNVAEFDRESFLEELADVAHYLIEIFILLGVTPKQAFNAYVRKGTINVARINGGY